MSIAAPIIGLIGSIASGIGSGMMAKQRAKEEEKAQIAEEKRREARYSGIGEAASVKDPTQADRALNRGERNKQRVGARPDRVGDRYDRNTELSGLGQRPKPDRTRTTDIPSGVSVAQGAAPTLTGAGNGVQPAASVAPVTQPKPRYSYNPQTQRIDFAGAQQPPRPAGLPPRPNMMGGR